jgi:hypothetical protein
MAKKTSSKSAVKSSSKKAVRKKSKRSKAASTQKGEEDIHFCSLPVIPPRTFQPDVSPNRAALILTMGNKWVNGTELHYYFFPAGPWSGGESQQDVVRSAFDHWKSLGIGLNFREVDDHDESEIRIGFAQGDGSWSFVGTYALNIGQNQRTMNFGWDLTRSGGMDTALHEIGHAMGLPHEHQNPNAGIVWNEEAVYSALAGPPNFWTRDETFHNIIRKISPDSVQGSEWDPDSVMHYPFQAGLIHEPAAYRNGLNPAGGLSARDIQWILNFYPAPEARVPELRPFQSAPLDLMPGQQTDFLVNPSATRAYQFQTFGPTDTVIVLFEKRDEEWRYVAGDDDSGEAYNARLETRLVLGREYMLRVRLYWSNASGSTAVMYW